MIDGIKLTKEQGFKPMDIILFIYKDKNKNSSMLIILEHQMLLMELKKKEMVNITLPSRPLEELWTLDFS